MKPLNQKQLKAIANATYRKTAEVGLKHAMANKPFIKYTINDLKNEDLFDKAAAIVLSAGPSLHRVHTAEKLVKLKFEGPVVACDGSLGYCLRNGLIPDCVVCVDPHPTRIVRWFGDSKLAERTADDYFMRQDLDPKWLENERKHNEELVYLVNKYSPQISMIFSTSVAPSVTQRAIEAGATIYWFNPIYDDYDDPNSLTRKIFALTRAPCLVTGGNVGTLAWVFAGAILRAKQVGITGMDFGYHPETPLNRTQYYPELKEMFGDRYSDCYIYLDNPYLKERWYTDPTYWWYRQSFLQLAQKAPFKTYNCTEGGTLFGRGIHWERLDRFVKRTALSLKGRNN